MAERERNPLGQFLPTPLPPGVGEGHKEVKISDIIQKYGFGIRESTCCADVDYDLETQEMTVQFQQRGTYVYSDVPLDEFLNFQQASSRGLYFNLYVRNRYSYERIA